MQISHITEHSRDFAGLFRKGNGGREHGGCEWEHAIDEKIAGRQFIERHFHRHERIRQVLPRLESIAMGEIQMALLDGEGKYHEMIV